DEVDRGGRGERPLPLNRDVSADEPDAERGVLRLQRLGDLDVRGERGRAGVQDGEVILAREWANVVQHQAIGRRVHQARSGHEGRRLGEPRWIPEGADFATRLVTRSGAAVEAVIRRWMQEERSLKGHGVVRRRRPWESIVKHCPYHLTARLQNETSQTPSERTSRTGSRQASDTRSRRPAVRRVACQPITLATRFAASAASVTGVGPPQARASSERGNPKVMQEKR